MKRSVMMFLSLLVAVALCVPASAAITTVSSPVPVNPGDPRGPVNPGWNLMALPAIPTSPAPDAVLDEYPDVLLNQDLYRWDTVGQGLCRYDGWDPETFGNLLITEGYWIVLGPDDNAGISFEGITDNDNTDMWISLPKAGWTIIGCPFSYSVNWNTVEITDGTVTVPLLTARDNFWLNTVGYWWDSTVPGGGLCTMGLDEDFQDFTTLEPWHGYWIQSMRDNLALIVPASAS